MKILSLSKIQRRQKMLITFFVVFVFIFGNIFLPFISKTEAVFNKQINYQGKLTDASNVAVANASYNIEFKLYTTLSGGSAIWTETRTGGDKVPVTNGLFSVMLGEVNSLSGVDFNQTLYLGVKIESDAEMTPRKKLGAVPAAIVAEISSKAINLVGGNDTTLLGAIAYQSNTDITSLLTPNISTTKNFLTMTGTGVNGAVPAWGAITQADVSGLTITSSPTFAGITSTGNVTLTGANITGASPLVFDGATADAFKTTFAISDPTGVSKVITFPNTTGTVITTGDTGTVTNTMLANSTISGIALGSNLGTLTIGTGLSGTSYNGGTAVTVAVNTSQNISTLSNLTTDGFVKTSGGTGALSIDTTTYLPAVSFSDTGVTSKLITGYVSGAGVVAPTDTILQAIQKLDGNISASGSGTVTSVDTVVANNGVSATWTNISTTPRLTIGLGNITPTTVNGLTLSALGTGFSIAGGTISKTLTINNTLGLSGTDGSTLNIGAGGTLGSNAFNSTAYQSASSALTSLAALSWTSGTPFVKMTAAGTFALDTTAYGTGSVTSVAALTLGTTGTDLSSTVANGTTTPVITLNVPTASATNRGVLSSTDWSTFNGKQNALSGTGFVKSTAGVISYDTNTYLTSFSEADTLATVMARGATTGVQLTSTLATGTSPFAVTSTTVNTNLNADLLDGLNASAFQAAGSYEAPLTFTNGLTRTANDIHLGGTLTEATTITQDSNAFTIANNGTANTTINLSSTGNFDVQDNGTSALYVKNDGNVGIGTTAPGAKLEIDGTMAASGSSTAIAGILGGYTFNPTAGGVQVGNRFVVTNTPTTTANTAVGEMVRMVDNTSLANLVRGLDITSNAGSNTAGTNTGLRASGATFGVQGITSALAGGQVVPAALYGESTGTTQGNVLRLYSNTMTSASSFATFYQTASAFTGTGLLMDFAVGGSGTFTGNFMDLKNNGASVFKVTSAGITSIGLGSTASTNAVCSSLANGTAPTAGTAYELRDCNGAPAADYAEMYPVGTDVEYGDIVALGSDIVETYDIGDNGEIDWTKVLGNISKLVKSKDAYQENVIGIVSNNTNNFSSTGYNIKETDNPMPVALNGRVPVKISMSSSPIKVGDYLTTSMEEGKATRALKSGFVIGKALEDWTPESGKNMVMMFIEQGYYESESAHQFASEVTFNGLTYFNASVEFAKSVKFTDTVEFEVPPLFNNDTAGFAVIKAGSNKVDVTFDKAYIATPVVNTTITFDKQKNGDGSTTTFDTTSFFNDDIKLVVVDKDENGFTIAINKNATEDISFSWIALAVKNPKIFESVITGLVIDSATTPTYSKNNLIQVGITLPTTSGAPAASSNVPVSATSLTASAALAGVPVDNPTPPKTEIAPAEVVSPTKIPLVPVPSVDPEAAKAEAPTTSATPVDTQPATTTTVIAD